MTSWRDIRFICRARVAQARLDFALRHFADETSRSRVVLRRESVPGVVPVRCHLRNAPLDSTRSIEVCVFVDIKRNELPAINELQRVARLRSLFHRVWRRFVKINFKLFTYLLKLLISSVAIFPFGRERRKREIGGDLLYSSRLRDSRVRHDFSSAISLASARSAMDAVKSHSNSIRRYAAPRVRGEIPKTAGSKRDGTEAAEAVRCRCEIPLPKGRRNDSNKSGNPRNHPYEIAPGMSATLTGVP